MAAEYMQAVEQGQTSSLEIILLDDNTHEPITLSGTQQIQILGTGGGEVVPQTSTGVSASGSTATYTRTWDSATFERFRGYRAVWTLSDGSTTYVRPMYFEVVRRIFRSMLTDDHLTSKYTHLSSRLPDGVTSFARYREDAWQDITLRLRQRIPEIRTQHIQQFHNKGGKLGRLVAFADSDYPGNLFNPEAFLRCHEFGTLAEFYRAISIGGNGQDADLAAQYEGLANEQYDIASSKVAYDLDDDGLLDVREREFSFNAIRVKR